MNIEEIQQQLTQEQHQQIQIILQQLLPFQSTQSNEFYQQFQQCCFQLSEYPFETIKDKAILYNHIYEFIPLITEYFRQAVQSNSIESIVIILKSIKMIPLDTIIDDIQRDLFNEMNNILIPSSNSFIQFLQSIDQMKEYLPSDYQYQSSLVFVKKYLPILQDILFSSNNQFNQIIQNNNNSNNNQNSLNQLYDIQYICNSNKSIKGFFIQKIFETISNKMNSFSSFHQSKEFLQFFINVFTNLPIIDGSLQLSKKILSMIIEKLQTFNVLNQNEFFSLILHNEFPSLCFSSNQWDHQNEITCQSLENEYQMKIPIQCFQSLLELFGNESILELYEKDLSNKLIHSHPSEIQQIITRHQFYTTYFIDPDECYGEIMCNDIKKSFEQMDEDDTFKSLIISSNYWNSLDEIQYIDLPIIQQMKQHYISQFSRQNKKKKLTFKQQGRVKLQYKSLSGIESEHVVTPLQATVLMIITQHDNGILFHDLQQQLGINESRTRNAVSIWLDKGIVQASEYMGTFSFKIV